MLIHRRYEKKREAQQKAAEQQKKQSDANVDAAGLRQFGAGQAEALEAAFKSETVRRLMKHHLRLSVSHA